MRTRPLLGGAILAAALAAGCSYGYRNPAEQLAAGEVGGRTVAGASALDGVAISLRGATLDASSRRNGRFGMLPLPVGTHTLVFRKGKERAVQRDVEVRAGRDGQPAGVWLGDVQVPAAATLQGTTVLAPRAGGGARAPVGDGVVLDEVSGAGALLRGGVFRMEGLPVGEHRLRVYAADAEGTVLVGGPREVTLEAADAGRLVTLTPAIPLVPLDPGGGDARVRFRFATVGDAGGLTPPQVTVAGLPFPVALDASGHAESPVPVGKWTIALQLPPSTQGVTPPPEVTFVATAGDVVDLGTLYAVADGAAALAAGACHGDGDCAPEGTCLGGRCEGWAPASAAPARNPLCDLRTAGCQPGALRAGPPDAATCKGGPFAARTVAVTCGSCCTPDGVTSVCASRADPGCAPAPASSAKAITSFAFVDLGAGVVDEAARTIAVTVPFGTSLARLVATFATTGARVSVGGVAQASGVTPNDFSAPVSYVVTAEDGSTATYVVTVTVAPSSARAITAFAFVDLGAGVVDEAARTIAVTVPFGTSLTRLVATFATTGARVSVGGVAQASGVTPNDFSAPVSYVVTAEDGTTATYVVTVTVAPSPARELTAFEITSPLAVGVIDAALRTVSVTVPAGTAVTSLVAAFTTTGASVTVGGVPQLSGVTANDFSAPVSYVVTARDGSTATYVVTVTVAPSSARAITAFAFAAPLAIGTVDEATHAISVTVPFGTPLAALVATYTTTGAAVTVGGVAQVSGVTPNDFSAPVSYVVTAQDGTTATYVVTVTVEPGRWVVSGAVTGAVVGGVTVSLAGDATATAITDALGRYAFPGLLDGMYVLSAARAGFVLNPAETAVTVQGADVGAVNFGSSFEPLAARPLVAGGAAHSAALRADGTLWTWGSNPFGGLGNGTSVPSRRPAQVGTGFARVAAGGGHTLALRPDGQLLAWGENTYGQLGDGSTTNRATAVPVVGAGYVAVAAGRRHTLALGADGRLWAWGWNLHGTVGNATTADQPSPAEIGTGFVAIAAGAAHSAAVRGDGTLWAWGANASGELGDGTTVERHAPVQVGAGFAAVVAGERHTVALAADGSLWTWGANAHGQLGDGTTTGRRTPAQIGAGFAAVAAGAHHTLALGTDGALYAWGYDADGQVGDGATADALRPVRLGTGYAHVAAGAHHSLAVRSDGTVVAWGQDAAGQLGDGAAAARVAPGAVALTPAPVVPIVSVASRFSHTALVKGDGSLFTWGANNYGQLGDGTAVDSRVPLRVGTGYAAVATGTNHTVGLRGDGTLWAWGDNAFGQLGDGTTTARARPVQVLANVRAVATGALHTLAVLDDGLGTLVAWGFNAYGQLGDGTRTNRPSPTAVGTGYAAVAAGSYHTLAVTTTGALRAFGYNFYGQLGDGTTTDAPSPVEIGTGYAAVAAGEFHSLAVGTGGALFGWGNNGSGQVGDGTTANASRPVQIGAGYAAVAAGTSHSAARDTSGTIFTWGDNSGGQLGDGGAVASRSRPAAVGAAGYALVAAGDGETFRARADGSLEGWGRNASGVLGDGTSIQRASPVAIGLPVTPALPVRVAAGGDVFSAALGTDGSLFLWGAIAGAASPVPLSAALVGARYASVAAGFDHVLAVDAGGTLWAWGANAHGQLGDGTTTDRPDPVAIGTGYAAAAAGHGHSLAVRTDGTLLAWGDNLHGQVGDGTATERWSPVPIGTGYRAVAAGAHTSFALQGGTLHGWGENGSGQVGDGSGVDVPTPTAIADPTGAGYAAVSAGAAHTLALTAGGDLLGWGSNAGGQLGIDSGDCLTPCNLGTGYVSVAAGSSHGAAVRADGMLETWGLNDAGQLCEGDLVQQFYKVPINTGFTGVGAGGAHTFATRADGSLWACGRNDFGQLGVGSLTGSTTAVQVPF